MVSVLGHFGVRRTLQLLQCRVSEAQGNHSPNDPVDHAMLFTQLNVYIQKQ